jgi:histidyl-tRNA synthetase
MIQKLKYMNDIVDDSATKYNYIVNLASEVAKNYGFKYINTPIIEMTSLFKRSVGESSDIVNKEMYNFTDKGDRDICMRPEGTAGVVRHFVESKKDRQQPSKFKYFYFGKMYRYERGQKGRYREFNQFGCESFGEPSVLEDFMIIEMISTIFDKLNIKYALEINSIGCDSCMPVYKDNLVKFLEPKKDALCQDCQRRLLQNPMRVLDCKNSSCQEQIANAPKITNNLCESCDSDFKQLVELLDNSGIEYNINTNLVRGLDYYNKTAFEFVSKEIGSQGAIAGGGRYDKLVEFLDGKSTPAVGFAMGIERLMMLIDIPKESRDGYYLGALDANALSKILEASKKIRINSKAYVEYGAKNLKGHLKNADRFNAKYCAVIGEEELQNGTIWVKNLEDKSQDVIDFNEFIKSIG